MVLYSLMKYISDNHVTKHVNWQLLKGGDDVEVLVVDKS